MKIFDTFPAVANEGYIPRCDKLAVIAENLPLSVGKNKIVQAELGFNGEYWVRADPDKLYPLIATVLSVWYEDTVYFLYKTSNRPITRIYLNAETSASFLQNIYAAKCVSTIEEWNGDYEHLHIPDGTSADLHSASE